MSTKIYQHEEPFELEGGGVIDDLKITYTTYGKLNKNTSNVVWIIHALTANSFPLEWWSGLTGTGKLFDPEKYFIVCANNLGSCYGTTGPGSIDPHTGKRYGGAFPLITIRDMTNALDALRKHLKIKKIHLATGGSMGGQIALEWAIMQPDVFERIVPIATNARHSAWGIAFNEAQRLALKGNGHGLHAARAIAMLSYRGYDAFVNTQTDTSDKLDNYRASTYQQYQGEKLANRFDRDSYVTLSKAMDTHNVGRGRVSIEDALARIKAKTLVIGISSDILFPLREQEFLCQHIKKTKLAVIDSGYGHDGFLIEYDQLTKAIGKFMKSGARKKKKVIH